MPSKAVPQTQLITGDFIPLPKSMVVLIFDPKMLYFALDHGEFRRPWGKREENTTKISVKKCAKGPRYPK
jgi:hypothetical protein